MFLFSWSEFGILFGAAVLGVACVTPYTLELTAHALKKAQERTRQPRWVLVLLQNTQSFVLMGVATGLGSLIAHHSGLGAPLLDGLLADKNVGNQAVAMIAPALILGIASSTVLLLLEVLVFWPRLPSAIRTTLPYLRCGNASWRPSTAASMRRFCAACSCSRCWHGLSASPGMCLEASQRFWRCGSPISSRR